MITPDFSVGDTVYLARPERSPVTVQCPTCKGTRKWTVSAPGHEDWEVACQTCYTHSYPSGSRGTVAYTGFSTFVRELTIGSVRLDTADERPVSYMAIETGVGSGWLYYEDELFETREEAEVASDALATRRYGEEYTLEQERQERRRTDSDYELRPPDPMTPLRTEINGLKKTNKILKTHNKTLRAKLKAQEE